MRPKILPSMVRALFFVFLSISLNACQDSTSTDDAQNFIDQVELEARRTVADALSQDSQHLDLSESLHTINTSGVTLNKSQLVVDVLGEPKQTVVKGQSATLCMRLHNLDLPSQSLKEVGKYIENSNLRASVILDNSQNIPLSISRSGIIGTSTSDQIKPDDTLNVCLNNHNVAETNFGHSVDRIAIYSDTPIVISRIQWGSHLNE